MVASQHRCLRINFVVMKILIDNGHARDTVGRRSPDKTFYEWEWNREIAIGVVDELDRLGYDAERVVLEDDYDVSLYMRAMRVNKICREEGRENVIFVSIHANANTIKIGEWKAARGVRVYVARNANEESKLLAKTIYDEAVMRGYQGNRHVPKEHYWFKQELLKDLKCTAVLTGNLFYDNKEDLYILKSDFGKKDIIDMHVQGILRFLNRNNSQDIV